MEVMNRVTVIFLVLLALATLASGELWVGGRLLAAGDGAVVNGVRVGVSALVLTVTFVGLIRIVWRTMSPSDDTEVRQEEQNE